MSRLVDGVERGVEAEEVAVGAAGQRVDAEPAAHAGRCRRRRQRICRRVAGQHIGQRVADAADRRRSGERQVLDRADTRAALARLKCDRRLHRVGAVAAGLVDDVAGIVDDIGVGADTPEHRVGADAAVQHVVAAAAVEHIGRAVAEQLFAGGAAGQAQRLDAERVDLGDVGGRDGEAGVGPDFPAVDDVDLDVRRADRHGDADRAGREAEADGLGAAGREGELVAAAGAGDVGDAAGAGDRRGRPSARRRVKKLSLTVSL